MSLTIAIPSIAVTGSASNIGGSETRWLCPTDLVTSTGSGSNTYFLESGSQVDAAGGGSCTYYVKAGATLNISGGGGSNTVFYETGAIINNTLSGGGGNTFTVADPIIFDYTNAPESPCRPNGDVDQCNCHGCNDKAPQDNLYLASKAQLKHNTVKTKASSPAPFPTSCKKRAIKARLNLQPSFYLHWGDGTGDRIEEHDTEILYLTVCNHFSDVEYRGLRITRVAVSPSTFGAGEIELVPDRLIHIDCLNACSCATREFALITRGTNIAGNYSVDVDYCFDSLLVAGVDQSGSVKFPIEITND